MSIIISQKGQLAQKIDRAEFEKEDYLQNYIHENPESIPVYEIEEDKKLFVVAREFPTESGPIDALAIDKDGDIYVVETKLYKNPDKRTVVAQALDYGASLWKHTNNFNEFIASIDQEVQNKFSLSFSEKASQFFGIEQDEVQLMLDRMENNLKDGNIKFVILMDSMGERLKDLIIYVNQNSRFDVYAVQLEYYKFNEYEIMIPKIFGVEIKKSIQGTSSSGQRRRWSKEEFLTVAKKENDSQGYKRVVDLLRFSEEHADKVVFGTGNDGVFSYKIKTPQGESTILTVYSNGASWSTPVLRLQGKLPKEHIDKLADNFRKIKGVEVQIYTEKGVKYEEFIFSELDKIGAEELKKVLKNFNH